MDVILRNFMDKCDRENLRKLVGEKSIYIWGAYPRSEAICRYLLEGGLDVKGYIETKKLIGEYNGLPVVNSLDQTEVGERRNYYVIPLVNGLDGVLNELVRHNVDIYEDVLWITVEKRIRFTGGYYKDECGNEIIGEEICTDKCCEILLKGYGNKVWIGKGSICNDTTIQCGYGSIIKVGKGCVVPSTTTINVVNGRFTLGDYVVIGENVIITVRESVFEMATESRIGRGTECVFCEGATFKAAEKSSLGSYNFIKSAMGMFELGKCSTIADKGHFFVVGTIRIGEDCMFSDCVHLLAGSGHVMECGGELWGKMPSQTSIVIGNHVWMGFDSYVQDDTFIGDGSIVGANAKLRNMHVPENTCVVGDGKIVKSNIEWKRDWLKK